jgi:hypothetical protein
VLTALALELLGLGGDAGPSASPSPSPTGSGAGGGGASATPFLVTARQENEAGCTALPDRLSTPRDRAEIVAGGDVAGVVRRHHGARAHELVVGLTLEGGPSPLTVTSIDIEPASPRAAAPLTGTLLCEAGAGGEPKIELFADMDAPKPLLLGAEDSSRGYFRHNAITLQPGEQVNLSATFRAEKGSREFELVVRYVRGGKEGARKVPAPKGGRYAVTGYSERYGAVYEGSPDAGYHLVADPRPCRWMPGSQGC